MDNDQTDLLYARNKFETDGFAVVTWRAVPDELLQNARAAIERVRKGMYNTGIKPRGSHGCVDDLLCKINNAHVSDSDLFALVSCPEIGRLAALVTGSRMVQVWASQLLVKPPSSGTASNVGWHQDYQYWRYWDRPEGLFTVWIALSDVNADSGPVCFVPQSQRWGLLETGDFFETDQSKQVTEIRRPNGAEWSETPAIMPAGGVSLHSSLTYHGSGPNTSPVPRLSIAVHMRNQDPDPVDGSSEYYVSNLNDPYFCPVIHDSRTS